MNDILYPFGKTGTIMRDKSLEIEFSNINGRCVYVCVFVWKSMEYQINEYKKPRVCMNSIFKIVLIIHI